MFEIPWWEGKVGIERVRKGRYYPRCCLVSLHGVSPQCLVFLRGVWSLFHVMFEYPHESTWSFSITASRFLGG